MSRLYDLKVNSRECILGLDDDRIYFGWKFNTAASGVIQKSCQVRLYEGEDRKLVWDSQVRQTDESAYFRYDGEKLEPAARYYWSVEAVDNHDCVYFGESWFETGLKGCSCSVWDGAQFIGSPYDSVNTDSLADYIVSSHISVGRSERTGLAFNVRDKDNYMSIELAFASGKCFVNRFNDAAWTDAVPYSVKLGNADGYSFDASSLAVYDEKKEKIYSADIRFRVEGTKLSLSINDCEVIKNEDILPKNEAFMPRIEGMGNLGIIQKEGFCGLDRLIISYMEDGNEHILKTYDKLAVQDEFYVFNPAAGVCVRKSFESSGSVKKARLYATAMGFYDVYINGEKINNSFYNPGFTDYRKRLMYQTYDVTDALRTGENVLGAVVMKGYYTGYVGYTAMPMVYGKKNAFLAKLVVEYTDGRTQTIITDKDWDFTDEGQRVRC